MINMNNDIRNLTGKILISTPSISNEYLNRSMVYICSHDKNGAMGIVINKIIPNMSIKDILKKLQISFSGVENIDTYFGGTNEIDRCFIIHSDDYLSAESVIISDHVALTINSDILRAMTSSGGPSKKILCMGCCLWETEQLEDEVASSYWIPVDADEALIFGNPSVDKWSKALMKIGSRSNLFLDTSGNA
jgi:putative transcriptional regulator